MLRAAGDIQATHSAADGVEASWSTAREVMLVRVFQTSRLPTLQAPLGGKALPSPATDSCRLAAEAHTAQLSAGSL